VKELQRYYILSFVAWGFGLAVNYIISGFQPLLSEFVLILTASAFIVPLIFVKTVKKANPSLKEGGG